MEYEKKFQSFHQVFKNLIIYDSNFFFSFYIGVSLINNVVLVSGDSKVIQLYIYISIHFEIIFLFSLS